MNPDLEALSGALLGDASAVVTIRAHAHGHIYTELVRDGQNVVIAEGMDVEDALENLSENVLSREERS